MVVLYSSAFTCNFKGIAFTLSHVYMKKKKKNTIYCINHFVKIVIFDTFKFIYGIYFCYVFQLKVLLAI